MLLFRIRLILIFVFIQANIQSQVNIAQDVEFTDPVRIDISHRLLRGDIYKSAINQIKQPSIIKKSVIYEIGDTTSFFVRNIFDQNKWNRVMARLVFDTLTTAVWIDTTASEIPLTLNQQNEIVNSLKRQLLYRTPQHSVNPDFGIFKIMDEYYGKPPDIDGDGKTDILLLDIRDDFENSGAYVAGFFDPNDMTDSGSSNKRDMLYIDIYPNILYHGNINTGSASSTIAHEYQHLIHINYEGEEWEYVFINEGLSELAEIICGYKPRSADFYLKDPSRSLFSWDYDDPIADYSRASLWMNWLFEQIGYQNIKLLVQSPLVGLTDIENVLSKTNSKSFDEVFSDWGRANLINDISINPAFGYVHPLRKNIRLLPEYYYDRLPVTGELLVAKQSMALIEFPFTSELVLQLHETNPYLALDAQIFYPDTFILIKDIYSNPVELNTLDYSHGSSRLLIKNREHANKEEDDLEIFPFIANGKKTITVQELCYDDGSSDPFFQNASYFLLNGYDQKMAVAFKANKKSWLKSFSLKTIFLSELQGSSFSSSEPRDINIQIASISNGKPDRYFTDPGTVVFKRNFGNLKFEEFSLMDNYEPLSAIQDSFCIIISNDIDDSNFVAIGMDSSEAGNTFAFLDYGRNGFFSWQKMDSVEIGGNKLHGWNGMARAHIVVENEIYRGGEIATRFENSFQSVSLTIAAPFAIDTLNSACAVILPKGEYELAIAEIDKQSARFSVPLQIGGSYSFLVHLQQQDGLGVFDSVFNWNPPYPSIFMVYNNYPNPFNNSTTVPFILLEEGALSYDIYNTLGQKVLSKNAGQYTSGKHQLTINFQNRASGIYFIRMNMKGASRTLSYTQKLILIK